MLEWQATAELSNSISLEQTIECLMVCATSKIQGFQAGMPNWATGQLDGAFSRKLPVSVPVRAISWWRRPGLAFGLCCYLCSSSFSYAAENPARAEARNTFAERQALYAKEPQNIDVAWQFARACFDFADFATNRSERAELAQQGIGACRQAIARQSNSAPSHYYLALNLGQLARTRTLGALRLVSEMEKEFLAAIHLDPHFDYAGPDRSLGLLYRDAPAFGSIGSRPKAREHLQRAVELEPDYPENRLTLIESELKWNDRTSAGSELKALEQHLPKAHAQFSGPGWAGSWADWDQRLAGFKKVLQDGH